MHVAYRAPVAVFSLLGLVAVGLVVDDLTGNDLMAGSPSQSGDTSQVAAQGGSWLQDWRVRYGTTTPTGSARAPGVGGQPAQGPYLGPPGERLQAGVRVDEVPTGPVVSDAAVSPFLLAVPESTSSPGTPGPAAPAVPSPGSSVAPTTGGVLASPPLPGGPPRPAPQAPARPGTTNPGSPAPGTSEPQTAPVFVDLDTAPPVPAFIPLPAMVPRGSEEWKRLYKFRIDPVVIDSPVVSGHEEEPEPAVEPESPTTESPAEEPSPDVELLAPGTGDDSPAEKPVVEPEVIEPIEPIEPVAVEVPEPVVVVEPEVVEPVVVREPEVIEPAEVVEVVEVAVVEESVTVEPVPAPTPEPVVDEDH